MKITKVYTRGGDKGKTSLVGGVRISKSDIRLEAYGTVDELSAQLGMLAAMIGESDERKVIIRIQNNLFNVCTHLATDQSQTPLPASAHLPEGETTWLEQHIDALNTQLPERLGFILPGGCVSACQAHVCRTVCRRAERRIAALSEVATVGVEIQQYVNRLSDYFFVLAKIINFNEDVQEILWENACK
jgi:cob(I)alamin adenosyltransferase